MFNPAAVRRSWPRPQVTACLAAVLLAGCGLQADISQRTPTKELLDEPAPSLQGPSLEGRHLDVAALKGRPVVVDFWASWCGPCRAEQPELNRLARDYTARGVAFIGVDIRDDQAAAQAYERELGVLYPSLFDPSSAVAGTWGVTAPPTTVVVDARGHIRLRELGTLVDVRPTLDGLLRSTSR